MEKWLYTVISEKKKRQNGLSGINFKSTFLFLEHGCFVPMQQSQTT